MQASFIILSSVMLAYCFADESSWNCTTLESKVLVPGAVQWARKNCTGVTPLGSVGPMIFNVLHTALFSSSVSITPMVAKNNFSLAPLQEIAAQDANVIGGINGGYFFRTDSKSFIDTVCWGKSRPDALQPANQSEPNDGIGDTAVVANGSVLSCNCDCFGYNRPATLVVNGTHSYILVQGTAALPPAGARDVISAGPNLVSCDEAGNSFIDIPKDDENINILEWSANTAVGIINSSWLTMVTADGYDGCSWGNPQCGIDSYNMAYFMKDEEKVQVAMGMDQGGSTTMFVAGEGTDGIVSCSQNAECTGSPRPLFSGLFVKVTSP